VDLVSHPSRSQRERTGRENRRLQVLRTAGHPHQEDVYDDALANLDLATDPLTQNRYALSAGNPVSFIEVDGHISMRTGPARDQSHPLFQRALPTLIETGRPTTLWVISESEATSSRRWSTRPIGWRRRPTML
jgi:hypothetical protein